MVKYECDTAQAFFCGKRGEGGGLQSLLVNFLCAPQPRTLCKLCLLVHHLEDPSCAAEQVDDVDVVLEQHRHPVNLLVLVRLHLGRKDVLHSRGEERRGEERRGEERGERFVWCCMGSEQVT